MRVLLIITFLTCLLSAYSQEQDVVDTNFIFQNQNADIDTAGRVVIHQSQAVKSILEKKVKVNVVLPKVKGYRIQILSVSGINSSNKANKEMANFLMNYPDEQAYIVYSTPYFKVRIGDFRNKLDAYHFLQKIIKHYPNALVVPDEVNIPVVEQNNTPYSEDVILE